ncbi:hypothetical protein OG874_25260 [Nocardia sp. NBC_00565]|uniref:hypothetical protein n=1 Tax=Nocardia sp. NBC_00565 TaxID=2975993 RepID=UPI002E80F91C|nr:hypothetical protein [Nocardia sp. NBC_00565]WUC00209.1 hypothetical protein OG874_25260 [Nocardia sp. NBC_00565]
MPIAITPRATSATGIPRRGRWRCPPGGLPPILQYGSARPPGEYSPQSTASTVRGLSVPIIVYSSSRGTAGSTRDRALLAGATLVTGSTTDLTAELAILGLLPQ